MRRGSKHAPEASVDASKASMEIVGGKPTPGSCAACSAQNGLCLNDVRVIVIMPVPDTNTACDMMADKCMADVTETTMCKACSHTSEGAAPEYMHMQGLSARLQQQSC